MSVNISVYLNGVLWMHIPQPEYPTGYTARLHLVRSEEVELSRPKKGEGLLLLLQSTMI
jgi:hypothetical protein